MEEKEEDKKTLQDIKDILEGRGSYGTAEILIREIGPEVIWIGENGQTASIGMWMRRIKQLLEQSGWKPLQGFRWFCVVNEDNVKQKLWYYGIQFEINEERNVCYVCGGATDYSGEGGHGKKIADMFIKKIMGPQVITRNVDYLLSMMVQ